MKHKNKTTLKQILFWLGLAAMGYGLVAAIVFFYPFLSNPPVMWGNFKLSIPIVFIAGVILLIAQDSSAFD